MSDIEKRDWSVVALHDVKNSCLPRLSEFLDRADAFGIEFRQDFPDDVVMMRRGEPVFSSFHELRGDLANCRDASTAKAPQWDGLQPVWFKSSASQI